MLSLHAIPDLLADLHTAQGLFVEWRRLEHAGLRRAQQAADQTWDTARRFRAYNPWMIPGILQTRAYTHAALSTIAASADSTRTSRQPWT